MELMGWLRSKGRVGESVMMPLRAGTKQPMFAHKKGGEWSRERSEAYAKENPTHTSWGLLLDGLIAVDCDDEASVAWVESQEDAETKEALGSKAESLALDATLLTLGRSVNHAKFGQVQIEPWRERTMRR